MTLPFLPFDVAVLGDLGVLAVQVVAVAVAVNYELCTVNC
jgi:hypothetical protein